MIKHLFLFGLCATILTAVVDGGNVVGCYYGSWAINRPGIGKFTTDNIRPCLCTHVYYSFIGLNNATQDVEILDTNVDIDQGGLQNFTALKEDFPNVKFLVAIGGWNQGSYAYSVVAQNASKRARFIEQIIDLIDEYGFDGLDFDWEYPAQRDTAHGSEDKENFVTLLREVKEAFTPLGLLVTIAVGASPSLIDVAYDVPALSNVSDLINFMTYDLHGTWESFTGINGPLRDPTGGFNVEQFVNSWLDAGVNASKLVLGIPLYGKLFTLANASDTSIGAPSSGPGIAGPYLQDPSNLAYYEILEKLQEGWTEVYDENYESPYAYSGDQWVGYDNVRSIAAKVEFACSKGLGGLMNWAIDEDDFDGNFGENYPLLRAMNGVLNC